MWSASGLRTNLARLSDGRSSMAAWLSVVRGRGATRVAATRWRRATCFAVPLLTLLLLPAMGLAYHVFFDRSGLPDLESFIRFTPPTIGEVYDARGAVLIRLAREYRRVVSYDEVPPVLRHAILSAEDKHFFIHSGVDYRSLPRVLQKKSEASPEPADGGVVAECAECHHQPSRPAKSGRLPGPSKTRVKLFTFRCGGSRAGTGPG